MDSLSELSEDYYGELSELVTLIPLQDFGLACFDVSVKRGNRGRDLLCGTWS